MRKFRSFVLPVSGLLLASCADFTAIDKLSTRMVGAAETWNSVAQRSQVACRRFLELGDAAASCTTEDRAAEALIAVNDQLAKYFATLGGVASDKNYSVSGGMADLSGTVAQIPGANADDVAAASGLAAAFANAFTQGRRERTMRRLIDEGGPAAQRIIAMMRRIAVPVFAGNLDDEQLLIEQALVTSVPNVGARLGPERAKWCAMPPRLYAFGNDRAAFLMALELCRRHRDVRTDIASVATYDASLEAAAQALTELQSGVARLGAAETAQTLYRQASNIKEKVDALKARRRQGEAE